MKCPKCGSEIPDSSEICPSCGLNFRDGFETVILRDIKLPHEVREIWNELSGYEYIGVVGEGGFSTVYKIKDKKTGKYCALKILSKKLISNEEALKRFIREGKLYQKFSHPNIVAVYKIGSKNKVPYIIMEYIDGITLKEYIQSSAPLSVEEVVWISKDIVSVLSYLHSNGVVHRDIKPANIMVVHDEKRAVLTDFGIAKDVEGSKLTSTGEIIGSPYYISPEQAKGEHIDGRSDIYSFGVTMYEMATGILPFKGETPVQIIFEQVKKDDLPKPSKFNPDIDPELEEIIVNAVKKDRNKRYQSAEELYDDIHKLDERIKKGKKPKKKVKPFYPLTLFLVVLVAVLFLTFYNGSVYKFIGFYKNYFKKYELKNKDQNRSSLESSSVKQVKSVPKKQEEKLFTFTVLTDKEAKIFIDGKKYGTTPPELSLKLKNGKYEVKVQFLNSGETIVKKVEIRDKPLSLLFREPEKGAISEIKVIPSGKIYIDGKYYGKDYLKSIKLKAGNHILTVKEDGYKVYKKRIRIITNKTLQPLVVELEPILKPIIAAGVNFKPLNKGGIVYVSEKIYLSSLSSPDVKGINELVSRIKKEIVKYGYSAEVFSEGLCRGEFLKSALPDEMELCIKSSGAPVLFAKEGDSFTVIEKISGDVLLSLRSKIFFKIALKK